jgi:hypothetical protein
MRVSRVSRAAVVVAGTSACLGLGLPAVRADAPVDSGWWTQANPGAPAPVPAVAPPDVPADGLLVQGGATDPVAFAGLIYEPEVGATAKQLVLKVVSPSGTTPNAVLKLCPLTTASLNAEQGGPIADAPAYDCTRSVTASPDADGGGYTFTLRAIASSGPFGVALLPTSPTDRVVLAKAGADSLVTTPAPFSPAPFPSEPAFTAAPQVPVAQAPALGAAELPAVTPSLAPQAPTVAEPPTDSQVQASVVPTVDVAATSHDHHAAVGGALLAALAAGCGLWAFAGRNPLEQLPAD